jgi:hypothetical protein
MQFIKSAILTAASIVIVMRNGAASADDADTKAKDQSVALEVRVVDSSGKAVGGAHVGVGNGYFSDPTWLLKKPILTNAEGSLG